MVFVFVLSVFAFVLSSGVRMFTVFILSSFPRVFFFPIFFQNLFYVVVRRYNPSEITSYKL